jgi:hypothetical protein
MNAAAALRGQLLDRRPAPVPAAPVAGATTCPHRPAGSRRDGRREARTESAACSPQAASGGVRAGVATQRSRRLRAPVRLNRPASPRRVGSEANTKPWSCSVGSWVRPIVDGITGSRREVQRPRRLPAQVPDRRLRCRAVFAWLKPASIARSAPRRPGLFWRRQPRRRDPVQELGAQLSARAPYSVGSVSARIGNYEYIQ